MKGTIAAILMLTLLVVLLISCAPFGPARVEKVVEGKKRVEVVWVEVNPPPGVEGPCYGFFQHEAAGYAGYGYAGVICPNACCGK